MSDNNEESHFPKAQGNIFKLLFCPTNSPKTDSLRKAQILNNAANRQTKQTKTDQNIFLLDKLLKRLVLYPTQTFVI